MKLRFLAKKAEKAKKAKKAKNKYRRVETGSFTPPGVEGPVLT